MGAFARYANAVSLLSLYPPCSTTRSAHSHDVRPSSMRYADGAPRPAGRCGASIPSGRRGTTRGFLGTSGTGVSFSTTGAALTHRSQLSPRPSGSSPTGAASSGCPAFALAYLGRRVEAKTALDECIAKIVRLHPFGRPYQMLALTLMALGRTDQAVLQALAARQRAWADGPDFSHRRDLRRAEATLAKLGVRPPALDRVSAEDRFVPYENELRSLPG